MTADLCEHCGEPESGVHWSRCYVCHPERRQGSMVGRCDLHRRIGAQCEGVAAYAGIVALGEWAARLHRRHEVRLKSRPPCYIAMLPTIIEVGRAHGYAIAVHGSLTRDLDLVASPWADDALPGVTLAKAVALATGGAMNPAPTEKPHGRRAWLIYTSEDTKVDLSVMPRQP